MSEIGNIFKMPTQDPFHAFRQQTGQELQDYADAHADGELDKSIKDHFSVKSTREELGKFAKFSKKWGIPISHIISALSAYPGVSAFCALVFSFFPFLGYELYTSTTMNVTVAVVIGVIATAGLLYGIEAGFDYFLYRLFPKLLNKSLRAQYGRSLAFFWVGAIVMGALSFCTSFFGATEAPKVVIKTPTVETAKMEDVTAPTNRAMDLISEQTKSYDSQIAEQQKILNRNAGVKGWKAQNATNKANTAISRLQQEKAASVGNLTGLGVTTVNGISARNAEADSAVQRSNRQKLEDYKKQVMIGSWVNGGISIFAQVVNALLVFFLCWFEFRVLQEETAISKHTASQNIPVEKHTNKQTNQTAPTDVKEKAGVFGTEEEENPTKRKPSAKEFVLKPVTYEGVEYTTKEVQNMLKTIAIYHKRSLEPISDKAVGANYDKSLASKQELKNKVLTFVGVLSCLGITCVFDGNKCSINYPSN